MNAIMFTYTDRLGSRYKLQQCLLSCVSTLCVQLAVPSREVETLAYFTLPYLSVDQPQGLQDTCVTCFRDLLSYDPDVVWLLLQQVYPNKSVSPDSGVLKWYSFKHCEQSYKCSTNVKNLLTYFC